VEIILVLALSSSTTAATAFSMPRLRSIGFMPAATALHPSLKMARVSTVAVVVPAHPPRTAHLSLRSSPRSGGHLIGCSNFNVTGVAAAGAARAALRAPS
jgi:hypothetical protein